MSPHVHDGDAPSGAGGRAAGLLGLEGPFATKLGYRVRAAQVTMASQVEHALERGHVLLCEAGTGTGKTLAYLLPAVLSGQRVVISTATKALQDQIVRRDLPALAQALGEAPSVAIAKGLGNYLCLRRFQEVRSFGAPGAPPLRSLPLVEAWAKETETGDIAELAALPETDAVWAQITSSSETRVGSPCEHFDACFVTRMREGLGRAQIVITNHHLFFADLALKAKAGPSAVARAGVLPPYEAVIFDEAHRVEDTISTFFGTRLSSGKIDALARDAERLLRASGAGGEGIARALDAASERFFTGLAAAAQNGAESLGRQTLDPELLLGPLRGPADELDERLHDLESWLETHSTGEAVEVLRRRCEGLRADLASVLDPATHHVAWIEVKRGSVAVGVSVIDVSGIVRGLVGRMGGVVFTSATLTSVAVAQAPARRDPDADDDAQAAPVERATGFSFLRRRLGLEGSLTVPVHELELESPFDYATRALLYVPRDLPEVTDPEFFDYAIPRAAELIEIAGGGALVLATSRRAMEALGAGIRRETGRAVMIQGDAPKPTLLDELRERQNAVLVATMGFWEGVDVPGDALRLVIVDRLPFAVPTDPLVQARTRALSLRGVDPFSAYSVPDATITLKQGVGRLLRSEQDRGVVAILDRRLVTKSYGKRILARLPLRRQSHELEAVKAMFSPRQGEGEGASPAPPSTTTGSS